MHDALRTANPPLRERPTLRAFATAVALAVLVAVPGVVLRLVGLRVTPITDVFIFGGALLGAGFLLSWGAEAAEEHVSQGLALAGLALVTVLPEYAVDAYYALQAGKYPDSQYVQFAAANMTGANRLLIGLAWPLIVFLFWWRSGRRGIQLRWENTVEICFLALASLYSFVITLKGSIALFDTVVLAGLFGAYLWRTSKLPKDEDDDDTEEVGPAAALVQLPKTRQYAVMAALTVVAVTVILAVAEPFAESLIGTGAALGVDQFFLIQWVGPLAGEAPEIIITILFTLALRPTAALGALVSDKINQWTLLVGMLPLFYGVGLGRIASFPLDARQHEEFFLTAAQSLFAVALLLRLRLSLRGAFALLGLFAVQFCLGFLFQDDEARTITVLTAMAWFYLVLAAGLFLWQRTSLLAFIRFGLFNQPIQTRGGGVGSSESEGQLPG